MTATLLSADSKTDREREGAHQDETEGPRCIEIEPAPRHELETQVAVDQPRQGSAGCDHRDSVDDGDQDRHAEIGLYEGACRLVTPVEVGGPAKSR